MQDLLTREHQRNSLLDTKQRVLRAIDDEQRVFRDAVHRDTQLTGARRYYAASRICALVRGFLARARYKHRLRELRAIKLLQRVIRGKLGRIKWQREFWKTQSLVQSKEALQELRERSHVVRQAQSTESGHSVLWQELFDPQTESFWYLQPRGLRNTWAAPLCFQRQFVCAWPGCRCVCANRHEYENHLRNAHRWRCAACLGSNAGITHPLCGFCGNRYDENGVDGEKAMKTAVQKVQTQLEGFLSKDLVRAISSGTAGDAYRLKDRLVEISCLYREHVEWQTKGDAHSVGDNDSDAASAHSHGSLQEMEEHHRQQLQHIANAHAINNKNRQRKLAVVNELSLRSKGKTASKSNKGNNSNAHSLPAIHQSTRNQLNNTNNNNSNNNNSTQSRPQSRARSRGDQNSKRPQSKSVRFAANTITHTLWPDAPAFDTHTEPHTAESEENFNGRVITAAEVESALSTGDVYDLSRKSHRTVSMLAAAQTWQSLGGAEGERERDREGDDVVRGVFDERIFDIATGIHSDDIHSRVLKGLLLGDDDDDNYFDNNNNNNNEEDNDEEDEHDENSSMGSLLESVSERRARRRRERQRARERAKGVKLLVCPGFVDGSCTLTTCLLAHPGVRDNAQVFLKAARTEDGLSQRVPFVFLCPNTDGAQILLGEERGAAVAQRQEQAMQKMSISERDREDFTLPSLTGTDNAGKDKPALRHICGRGKACTSYHVYVRPRTEEIILAMYPIRCGHRQKNFALGATLTGNVRNDMFNGYATMRWPNGSVYLGDYRDNLRHGFGIYRSHDEGIEYIGQFANGVRHGWGCLRTKNGDEYVGEWRDGKMEGVGLLLSSNGDLYRGEFKNNFYDGVGVFQKANGDVFLGYCKEGRAHGLGVLSLSTGEKYKGQFDRNSRHGKGACAYPNGSRYAGMWYRNVHQGYGVFISPQREKYIGEWEGGKKHGKGRYFFCNHDFYDGEFVKNKAKGVGVYCHANGNIYTGQWDNDMRNGRGTYLFANGSKYTGNWTDNNIHLKGKFDFANGAFYRGEFDTNTKHGRGIFTWPTGNIYKGEFVREKLCGKGEMQYAMGHRYVGQWRDNMKNGYGVMHYANGSVYAGNWENDKRQGKGTLTLKPGSPVEESYEGEWDNDVWHGRGKYCYPKREGTVYEGDWVRGVRHGQGRLSFLDGSFYRGDFAQDQMHGRGVYVDVTAQSQYDGEWVHNMRQGHGTCIEWDGSIYTGEWLGNMKHGMGKQTRSDGSVYSGVWEANITVGAGKVTIPVGDKTKRDGLKKEVTVRVFGY